MYSCFFLMENVCSAPSRCVCLIVNLTSLTVTINFFTSKLLVTCLLKVICLSVLSILEGVVPQKIEKKKMLI